MNKVLALMIAGTVAAMSLSLSLPQLSPLPL